MWVSVTGELYAGDCQPGDCAATDVEVAAWVAKSNSAVQRVVLLDRLAQIDIDSVRPLRAIAAGVAMQIDRDKLAALDAEAAALRAELAALT